MHLPAFDAEIIELCVRWYITYRLGYCDLVGMMSERGVVIAHGMEWCLPIPSMARAAITTPRTAGVDLQYKVLTHLI